MSTDFHTVRDQYPLPEVVARYCGDLKQRGSKYWSLCPFHDDTHADNFNIYRTRAGHYAFRCFACGEAGDVIDFVAKIEGCDVAEAVKRLTGDALPQVGTYKPKPLPKNQEHDWIPIVPAPANAPPYNPERTFNPVAGEVKNYKRIMSRLDAYRGTKGELLFYVIRIEFDDKNDKHRKATPVITYCEGPGGKRRWCAKRHNPPYTLLGLEELAARPKANVIVVSGEKCKAALTPVYKDYVVVTWLGGDDAVTQTDWSPLAGRNTVLCWPDADNPGNSAMNKMTKIVDEIEKNGTG